MGRKDEEFLIKYKGEVIKSNLNMTEVSYWIVEDYLIRKNNQQIFSEFRENFKCVQNAIGGNTQFLLEEEYISDETNRGADGKKRKKDYYVKSRPFLEHEYEGKTTVFGVYTQWKNEDDNSNFVKLTKEIEQLGYTVEIEKINKVKNNRLHENIPINLKADVVEMNIGSMEQIYKYINNKGFMYSKEELVNFYLSLKSKPFVILAGISGTGKSKLIKLFAESVGATASNRQYNLISVKPDWNDSTELLGYKNIKDEFIPGRLLEIIETASEEENKNKPYFVCLDEMNLARVEYYLSEYLSIIESREFEGEKIVTDKIFADTYLSDGNKYKGLWFPENLYIIGTINMDDTTFAFSRKVLDRANTIEFSAVDLEMLEFIDEEIAPIITDNSFLKTRFINIKDALDTDREYVQSINSKVVEINNILKEYSKHFGYRVRDEIVFYMLENNLAGLLDEDTAFDYQIMQKILPTIIGSDECIKDILIKLYNYCFESFEFNPDGDYVEEAKKNKDNAKYKLSANKIYNMLRGYRDGYTSFWL